MLNALIVVWRESLEAMLVIGVLLAWISRQDEVAVLRRALWSGVGAGVVLALGLALLTWGAQSALEGESLELFQIGFIFVAALLITQMVIWMHRHGRHMKAELEGAAAKAGGRLGLALVAALAVGREGAETVVFLYGLGIEQRGAGLVLFLASAAGGFMLAAATAWVVARGARFLNYRTVFRVSEILLLLVAGALLGNGIDRLIALDWLPPLLDPLWDTSALLDDGTGAGRLLADFAGYRARPSAVVLIGYAAFWSVALWRLRASR